MGDEQATARRRKGVDRSNVVLRRLEVEYAKVGDLRPNPYNPNRQDEHDFELLCRSITEDGFTQPVIVLRDGTIVDGEHRWRAAQTVGMTEIPVVRVDMSPEQMRISTLRHNRARGSEDLQLAADVLRDLRDLGATDWMRDSLMLDDVELQKMLDEVPVPELTQDDVDEGDASGDAAGVLHDRERRLVEAKTEEERQMALEDTRQVTMVFLLTPEQSTVVKAFLGPSPAQRLYELCKAAVDG